MNHLALFATPLILLAAPASSQTTMPANDYVAAAGASDSYEIQSSRLVLQTTKNAKVRSFAAMMVKHHTKSTADVKVAARRDRVPVPPPALNPEQADMIAKLRAAPGDTRDATYVNQQKVAHEKALALHSGFARDGNAPALKGAAAKITPVLQSHIQMLSTM